MDKIGESMTGAMNYHAEHQSAEQAWKNEQKKRVKESKKVKT